MKFASRQNLSGTKAGTAALYFIHNGSAKRQKIAVASVAAVLLLVIATIAGSYQIAGAESGGNRTSANTQSAGPAQTDSNSSSSNSSNLNVNLKSSSTSSSGDNSSSTSLTVNGQDVPVDQSGNVHQVFHSDNGHTTVNIDVQNGSTTDGGGM